jgi:hypothetical protein
LSASTYQFRGDPLLSVVSWLLRSLLGLGGALLVYFAWPVAWGAWYAQKADAVLGRLREGQPINLPDALAAIDALDHAVRANPSAPHHLERSELLVGAANGLNWAAPDSQRNQWLGIAQDDLDRGLAGAPARGVAWLRLAVLRQTLEGASPRVVGPLLMSIETAAIDPRLWPLRLELILRNWDSFTDAERQRVAAYVAMTWEASTDRRWFVGAMRQGPDELYLRILLGGLPGAQDELSMWIGLVRR